MLYDLLRLRAHSTPFDALQLMVSPLPVFRAALAAALGSPHSKIVSLRLERVGISDATRARLDAVLAGSRRRQSAEFLASPTVPLAYAAPTAAARTAACPVD